MAVDVRTVRTEAEKALVETYDRAAPSLVGGAEVRARRDAAFDKFRRNGLPHRRIEEWKYTDLRTAMRKAAPPAARPTDDAAAKALAALADPLAGVERYRLVLVDGYFCEALSDRAALAKAGVTVEPAAALLAANAALLATPELAAGDMALALNTAFVTDGVAVTVPDGAVPDRPLEIAHVSTGGTAHAVAVRNRVVIGAGANARIVETHRGPDRVEHQVNIVTDIALGAGATLGYARLQGEGDRTQHLGTTLATLSPGAEFNHLTVTAGAALSRWQLFLTIGGDRAKAGIFGAGMIDGRQHADVTLLIDHALPGATTRVLYKNVVDDDAQGVFQGKIIVEPDAQKTDARMMSQALLLSPTAEFDSKPELEIFADDVQCGHGSTAGEIDDTQLFYLMARGIQRAEAERLLIEAFLDSAIDALGDETLGEALKRTVSAWLAKRGARP